MSDKRMNQRVPKRIQLHPGNVGIFTDSVIMNISKGGVFLHDPKPKPVGAVIELEFTLPDQAALIKAKGQVVWSVNYETSMHKSIQPGMGVKFIEIDEGDKKLLQNYVQQTKKTE